MNNERIVILVDGSNLYHYLRDLHLTGLSEFNYKAFARFLARDRTLVSSAYYIGKIQSRGDRKGEELRRWQQRLATRLTSMGWQIKYGHMMERSGIFTEKGVDVHIAIDLLEGAYENRFDSALLVSSDTDLLPVIDKVRRLGKNIEYIGFAHRPSFGMLKNIDQKTLLHRKTLERFLL